MTTTHQKKRPGSVAALAEPMSSTFPLKEQKMTSQSHTTIPQPRQVCVTEAADDVHRADDMVMTVMLALTSKDNDFEDGAKFATTLFEAHLKLRKAIESLGGGK